MNAYRITATARPLDPGYATNRAIALLTGLIALAGFVVRLLLGSGWIDAALWGLGAGLSTFLAWALCRELDPDRDWAAFLAAGLAIAALFLWGLPQLLPLFWLLLALRIVNRTTGLPATPFDSAVVLGLGAWLAFQEGWIYGALTTFALLADALLPAPNRKQLPFAALGIGVALAAGILRGPLWGAGRLDPAVGGLVAVTALLSVVVIRAARHVASPGDVTGEPLHPRRVQAAQGLALLAGVSVALWGGTAGVVSLLPLWAALLGAALFRILRK